VDCGTCGGGTVWVVSTIGGRWGWSSGLSEERLLFSNQLLDLLLLLDLNDDHLRDHDALRGSGAVDVATIELSAGVPCGGCNDH
jgi:hypothetical protein